MMNNKMSSLIIKYLNLTYPNKLTFSQSNYHNKSIVFRHGDTEIGITRSDMDNFIRINNRIHMDISKWFGDNFDKGFINECIIKWLLMKYNSNNAGEILMSEWFGVNN
jgi:hypothetical protein